MGNVENSKRQGEALGEMLGAPSFWICCSDWTGGQHAGGVPCHIFPFLEPASEGDTLSNRRRA